MASRRLPGSPSVWHGPRKGDSRQLFLGKLSVEAVIFAFPLGFTGFRDSMMSVFDVPQEPTLPEKILKLSICCNSYIYVTIT